MLKEYNITNISKIGFTLLFIIIIINGSILLNFLFKLEQLNINMTISKNTHNSFLQVKNNTEKLLTSSYLQDSISQWKDSINNFNTLYEEYKRAHNEIDSNLYHSNKEIEKLILMLDKNFNFKLLKNKPILQIKGEVFNQPLKEDFYRKIINITDSIEYIIQNQTFVLKSFNKADSYMNKTQIKELDDIKKYAIMSAIVFFIFLSFVGYFTIKLIQKNELDLLETKQRLSNSVDEISRAKLLIQNILDTVPSRIFWKDHNSVYLGANKLFIQDAQLNNIDELIGKTDWQLKWKIEAQSYIDDDLAVMNTKENKIKFEETQTFQNGTVVNLITSKVALKDKENNVIGVLGIYDDITEQKKLELKLDTQNKLIEQQSKMASMGEMIGNIAHQWRQPLSIITMCVNNIRADIELDILDKNSLETIAKSITKEALYMSKTIDDFKNFIKGDRTKEIFNLTNNIESFLELVKGTVVNTNIQIIKNLQNDIELNNYPNELLQCYMNIVNNSKDALKEKDIENKAIFITTTKLNNKVIIKIKDNAGGIPENIINKVFEPYFTTKDKSQGTGLGLHMTYNLIVNGMGGTIEANNVNYEYNGKEYTGAEFIISLPME